MNINIFISVYLWFPLSSFLFPISVLKVLVIEYWNLRFICNLVLGICDFRYKTQRQSHLSLTSAMPIGQSF